MADEVDVATSTFESSDENYDNDDNNNDKEIVCLLPITKPRVGGGVGIGPPVIFIALVVILDTYNMDRGRGGRGGGTRDYYKYISPPNR